MSETKAIVLGVSSYIDPFHVTGLFYTPLKTLESQRFCKEKKGVYKETNDINRVNGIYY